MATQPTNQELVENFVSDEKYRDDLIHVEDLDRFLLYQTEEKYHKILSERELNLLFVTFFRGGTKSLTRGAIGDFGFLTRLMCSTRLAHLPKRFIAINDALIDLKTLRLVPLNKKKISFHKIVCDTDELKMPTPVWDKFLKDVLITEKGEPDPKLRAIIQEMFGYYLIESTAAEAAFFLYGEGANGKSKMLDVLEDMIGSAYTISTDLQTLTNGNHATADLVGMKLNIVRDEESNHIRIDKLKTLSSGESVRVNPKFKTSFVYKSMCKFIFSTNKIPSFKGVDAALKRRLYIIPFRRVFAPHERDHDIREKLREEMPGILQFALEGARRLIKNNYIFTEANQVDEMMVELQEESSSAVAFVSQNYTPDEDSFIGNDDLYSLYEAWCFKNGRKKMGSSNFFKDIKDFAPSSKQYQAMYGTTKRGRSIKERVG